MKKHSKQDNRRNKLNKLKKAKKLKNKKKIKERLREKPAVDFPLSLNFPLYKKSAMMAGMLAIICYIFLLHPVETARSADISNIKQTVNAIKIDLPPTGSTQEKLISGLPKPKGKIYDQILSIVKDTPMEKMADLISLRNRPVAGFLVGIAMKESKFGKYSPKMNGHDCYNYWGYRGKENPTPSGYSCFKDPEQAIEIVGNRIESMVNNGAKSPAQMITWKCGSTCAGHSKESVDKWISDVAINYYDITQPKQVVMNFNP